MVKSERIKLWLCPWNEQFLRIARLLYVGWEDERKRECERKILHTNTNKHRTGNKRKWVISQKGITNNTNGGKPICRCKAHTMCWILIGHHDYSSFGCYFSCVFFFMCHWFRQCLRLIHLNGSTITGRQVTYRSLLLDKNWIARTNQERERKKETEKILTAEKRNDNNIRDFLCTVGRWFLILGIYTVSLTQMTMLYFFFSHIHVLFDALF